MGYSKPCMGALALTGGVGSNSKYQLALGIRVGLETFEALVDSAHGDS